MATKTINSNLSIKDDIDSFVLDVKKKLAKGILTNVVRKTPFLTGQAKRNWIVSEGTSSTDFIRIAQNPIEFRTAENLSLTEGFYTINNIKVYGLTYIENNAPYIVRLNNGYSAQAPSMYIDTAILEEINKR